MKPSYVMVAVSVSLCWICIYGATAEDQLSRQGASDLSLTAYLSQKGIGTLKDGIWEFSTPEDWSGTNLIINDVGAVAFGLEMLRNYADVYTPQTPQDILDTYRIKELRYKKFSLPKNTIKKYYQETPNAFGQAKMLREHFSLSTISPM